MLLIFMFMFICRLSKKKIIRNLSLPHSSSILLIFMFMFICQLSQKKNICKELELGELEYLRKTIPSILFTKNSMLVCSSSILQGTRVYEAQVPHYYFLLHKFQVSSTTME